MCHYVPEIEFYMIQYLLTVKLCLPELEPTSIYPKHFCKKKLAFIEIDLGQFYLNMLIYLCSKLKVYITN